MWIGTFQPGSWDTIQIPLRAARSLGSSWDETKTQDNEPVRNLVVDLVTDVENWLASNTPTPWSVLRGPAGSGKSFFLQNFSAQCSRTVLGIELPVGTDLKEQVQYCLQAGLVDPHETMLIILDGLDEWIRYDPSSPILTEQSLRKWHGEMTRDWGHSFKVLIASEGLSSDWVKAADGPVWELLPFYLESSQQSRYFDPDRLLEEDQRYIWYSAFCRLNNSEPASIQELLGTPLWSLMARPLFARLTAELWPLDTHRIFRCNQLLAAVVGGWEREAFRDFGGEFQDEQTATFHRILEEVAFATTCRRGLPVSRSDFETHCLTFSLAHFAEFQDSNVLTTLQYLSRTSPSATKLTCDRLDPLLNAVPSIFHDYFLARKLKRVVCRIHSEMAAFGDSRWSVRDALQHWVRSMGHMKPDEQVREFLLGELEWSDTFDPRVSSYAVSLWQQTLTVVVPQLLSNAALRNELNSDDDASCLLYADINLLMVFGACAKITGELEAMTWPSPHAFANWFGEASKFASPAIQSFLLSCLSRLNLGGQNMANAKLPGADLTQANLVNVDLSGADLRQACLFDADLRNTCLIGADLRGADLREARMTGANLSRSDCRSANFQNANLVSGILDHADFRGADLSKAGLDRASFRGIDLRGAILGNHFRLDAIQLGAQGDDAVRF